MTSGVPERPIDPKAVSTAAAKMPTPREERQIARVLEALCDATRVKIVRALSEDNTLAAGDLAHVIGRSRSATSQHLKVLRDIGAVVARREGNIVRYSLGADVTAQVLESATAALERLKAGAGASAAE
jgi:ArsR family transcriptional regulator, lead/cadmium/zinc/bismuth-responsive transcriptional repressor